MTCTSWPDCSQAPRCARCVVMDACLAQVPEPVPPMETAYPWAKASGYRMPTSDSRTGLTALGWRTRRRNHWAKQVADRLLAWLRWPGRGSGCTNSPCTCPESNVDPDEYPCDVLHPLDADERGKRLRLQSACARCRMTGSYSVPMPDQSVDRSVACTEHVADYDTTVVLLDAVAQAGFDIWHHVHAWRPRATISNHLTNNRGDASPWPAE